MEENGIPISVSPTPPDNLQNSQHKKTNRKILLTIGTIFLILTITAGAYYLGKTSSQTQSTQNQIAVHPTPTSRPIPTPLIDASPGFSIYKNDEIGIEFAYPSIFENISTESEGCIDNKSNKRIDTPEGIHVFSLNKGSDSFQFMSTFIPYTGNCESPARGGGWADYARGITSNEDISQYCEKQKTEEGTSSCTTFTNPNGVLITKSVQQGYPGENTIMYRIKANKPSINGIILYDAVLKKDFKNSEEILDNIVNSLKFTN